MIILGLILLVIGWFTLRPLVYVGALLVVIGLVLSLSHTASPFGAYWY